MQIHHNSDPSAPPEEADDYEWIADSMNNQNDNNNIHHSPPKDFIQPNDMPIPDAIQQQLIYQRIMAEKENKTQEQKQEQKQQPIINYEYKQPQQPNNNNNNNNAPKPKPSFMSKDIAYPESALYKTAGIAVWRPKENGKGIQFMMGLENKSNSLSFFGGDKDANDKSCIDAALREFHEETGNKLDDDTLSQIRRMLMTDKDRCVFWKAEWNSILYYYQMSYDYDIVKEYKTIKKWNAEIKSIHWVDFDKMYRSVFITGNPIKLSKNNKFALRSFVVGMLLHEENRKYLYDLHKKYGGDMNSLKASNGGSIRNTVKEFTNIPKVIRLDILSPITYKVLYQKWVETDINSIEDYQLLMSLITSICPEIGRNFMLYYTDNKCFKTSKSQHLIDTIPAFTNLQKKLLAKSKNFVTQINIVPTFIVSDNFKGISLSFKKNAVLWKNIQSNNDDEKGFGAAIYNKASDWAEAWFGGENEDSNEELDGKWKWQFMNDSNKFEDFKSKNSKLLEATFMSRCSFTNFKRKNVNYQANFKTMCQKNLNTSNIRAIRRVPMSVKGDKPSNNNNNNNVIYNNYKAPILQYYKWQYKEDNGIWTDYATEISKQLNTFKVNSDSNNNNMAYYQYNWNVNYDKRYTYSANIKNKNNSLSYNYLIDVRHMKQKNVSTKKERDIRQIPVYNQNNNNNNNNYNNNYNYNFGLFQFKWQFKDDGYNKWTDFETSVGQFIESQYTMNAFAMPFNVNTNKKSYKIHFNTMQQQCLSSGKFRSIRRQQINFNNINGKGNSPIKHRWDWLDDDNTYKKYDKYTSNCIENACNSGIKKYFFVSNKNNNSYEINFTTMSQYNVQSGKQRKVRKVRIEPKWNGPGPNPKKWKGPICSNNNRRTFGKNIIDLYCVIGDMTATEVKKSGKLIRGTLGPFGSGLYFYDNISMTKQMSKDRSVSNKGNIIKAKVFIGKEYDVSNMDDKEFDFITLQKNGFDSISRSLGFGKEYIAYNMDQICIVKIDKY